MVSHDRYFISAVADQIWAVEDGIVRIYEAGYQDYLHPARAGSLPGGAGAGSHAGHREEEEGRQAGTGACASPEALAWGDPVAGIVDDVAVLEHDAQIAVDRLAYPGTRGLDELVTIARAHDETLDRLSAATDTLVAALWQELRADPLQ